MATTVRVGASMFGVPDGLLFLSGSKETPP